MRYEKVSNVVGTQVINIDSFAARTPMFFQMLKNTPNAIRVTILNSTVDILVFSERREYHIKNPGD